MSSVPMLDIVNESKKREQEMLAFLERIVRINSYTGNKAGVDAVGREIATRMEAEGFHVEMSPRDDVGDNLIVRNDVAREMSSDDRQVLFCGHMDTVFPDDGSFDCFRHEGDTIIGPGVVDMKGGLVVGMWALFILKDMGLLRDVPVTFVFNSDEETGSYHSRDLIMKEAARSVFAFVFECASPNGGTVTGRKGKATFNLTARGKSGHAGNLSQSKSSAILELAHKTIALEALNDAQCGVSVNVGLVNGGVGPNTIAPKASGVVECRFRTAQDEKELVAGVNAMQDAPDVPGTRLEVEVVPGRPPMEQSDGNRKLYRVVEQVCRELSLPIAEEFRGGVSDANYIAKMGVPVVDGMGPAGAKDHSPDEYLIVETLVDRVAISAISTLFSCRAWNFNRIVS